MENNIVCILFHDLNENDNVDFPSSRLVEIRTSLVNSSGFFRRNTLPVFSITSRNVRGNSSTLHARNNDAARTLY